MIPSNIDLNIEQAPVLAGIVGEHNARELHITPPVELLTADYYRAVFGFTPNAVYTEKIGELEDGEERGDTVLTVPLVMELTAQSQTTMTLEAYKNDGTYLGKSRLIHIVFAPAVGGTPMDVNTQPFGIAVEVADLQLRVSQLEQGGGILTVDTVDDLPIDAEDGTVAMVRFVDRTGLLPLEDIMYDSKNRDVSETLPLSNLYIRNTFEMDPTKNGYSIAIQAQVMKKVAESENYGQITKRGNVLIAQLEVAPGISGILLARDPEYDAECVMFGADAPEYGIVANKWYKTVNDGFILSAPPQIDYINIVTGVNYRNDEVTYFSGLLSPRPWHNVLYSKCNGVWGEL